MRHKTRLTLAAATLTAAASLSAPAVALEEGDFEYRTTKNLYEVCAVPEDSKKGAPAVFACRAFIAATVQYHDAISDRKAMKRLICYPQTATIADAREAFLAWAARNADNAKLMSEPPVKGLVRALAAAYPCK